MASSTFWWLNRLGTFAPESNPGSAVPNYGLTFDIATHPWDSPTQYNALVQSQVTSQVANAFGAASQVANSLMPHNAVAQPDQHKSIWDHVKDAAHWGGEQFGGAVGALDAGVHGATGIDLSSGNQYDKLSKEADKLNLKGWDRLKFIGGEDAKKSLGEDAKTVSSAPVAKQAFWALGKASEYSATAFVAGTQADKAGGPQNFFSSDIWGRAHHLVKQYDLNAGEAFTSMFYDQEILDDQARFEKIRQHSTVFNTSALAFNTIAAWKADPTVLGLKGAGVVRDLRRGKIAETGSAANIQRQILAETTREGARTTALGATGIKDRVAARYGLSLWDKSQQLRDAAQSMGYERFRSLAPFQNSASGTALAKLFQDTAHDDEAWNLVFRASIGDPTAIPLLKQQRADVASKIDAIELGKLPRLNAEMDRVSARMEQRLADQGRTPDQGLEFTRYSDWFLDTQAQDAKAALDEANAELATHQGHESWLARSLRGVDDGRQTGAIFNTLPQVNPSRTMGTAVGDAANRGLYWLGGKASLFAKDEFGKASRVLVAPRKPLLKRVGMVNLNDVEEGAQGVSAYLDQMAYIKGGMDQAARDHLYGRWAATSTDVERRGIVDELERQGIEMVLRKHGIQHGEMLDRVKEALQGKRADAWSRMSDPARYTTVVDPETGRRLDKQVFQYEDGDGAATKVAMPMDPTELPNWRPLTNLVDLDHELAKHSDHFRLLDEERSLVDRGLMKARPIQRWTEEVYNTIGETLNSLWKPAALLSLRWPARVVADESFRVMLAMGVWPHVSAWGEGARNVLYNTGFVKPYEWVKGRKIATGSLADDTLRTEYDAFDPFDPRSAKNPTGAVPVDAADFGSIDPTRYDKLQQHTAERRDWMRKAQMGPKPRWAQRFEDRTAAAEGSDSRGFFFDPVTHRARNKGFAVSVYPGRLRTFEKKPTAADLHWWMDRNSDLLSIPSNQVATWLDKGTGRWHLDVVRTMARREDAMQLASRANANEFFDIGDGFTRYLADEDPNGYLNGPLLNPEPDPVPTTSGEPVQPRLQKKRIGFGKQKWRSLDGKVIEGEGIYGLSPDDPNEWISANSSKGAFQQLFGGYTKGLGVARAKRSGNGARVFHPDDDPKAWAAAQSWYVNRHFRNSPIWLRMLNGDSDEKILSWLKSSESRDLRRRMPERAQNPRRWVDDMRAIFDHTLPTAEARQAAKVRDIQPKEWDNLIPEELRNEVHGDTVQMAEGTHSIQDKWRNFVDKSYEVLGSMPTDQLVRHPFARNVYNLRMRNYLASLPADQINEDVLHAAEASARAFATKQVRRLLYNIADENQLTHALRFVSPFFQAQAEVLERYAHLWTTHPESLQRTMQLFFLSQNNNADPKNGHLTRGLWYTVDKDGNPTTKFSHDNKVVFQVSPFLRQIADQIPGLKGALDKKTVGSMAIPVSSIDLIFQGDKPYLPQMGPLVTVPAAEFYFKDHPFQSESQIYKWLFPFGTPQGNGVISQTANGLEPAWIRRLYTGLTQNFNDSAFANAANIRYQDLAYQWEQNHGRPLPQRMIPRYTKQAMSETKAYWMLRAASSFLSPVPVETRSPQQFYIDLARKYRTKYGLKADTKFYNDVGADYFRYFTESTKSTNGLAPTSAGAKGYLKNKDLIDMAPDLAGVLAGPKAGDGKFNYEVYQWQLRTRKGPGSTETMREVQSPAQRIEQGQVDRGWIEYNKLADAIDVEMRRRGLTSLNSSAASDLQVFKKQKVMQIIERNPAWQQAYNSRVDNTSKWLGEANAVAWDKRLDGRTDIQGLRAYLLSREKVQEVLFQRQAQGGSASLSAQTNADLAGAWNSYLSELTGKNLLFSEIYHRYLESDDLTAMVTN